MKSKKNFLLKLVPALLGLVLISSGALFVSYNRFIYALFVFLGALFSYFFIVFALTDRNWMDIRALFSAVWLVTLALAALRLTNYQKPWADKTWFLSAIGYAIFQLGALTGIHCGNKFFSRISDKIKNSKLFQSRDERYFWICFGIGLVGILCFLINFKIKGFLPCFSDDVFAYRNFYTKFHVFAVAATMSSGLSYYCIKTQNISLWKKIFLWILIVYNIVVFPILVVSRGVFVVSALVFSTVFFYLNKKSLLSLILCVSFIMAIYLFASSLRSFSDSYLNEVFSPSKIEISDGVDEDTGEEIQSQYFQLSPKVVFLYGYLTVSHDNFNEAVLNSKECTWGLRQLKPFNVILRSSQIEERLENAEYYQVTPNLNTTNFFGIFYYDFHLVGIIIFPFLWAFLFGIMQSAYCSLKGPFSLMTLGNSMNPVVLSFFSSWVDQFDIWMFWGVILIMFLLSVVNFNRKKVIK